MIENGSYVRRAVRSAWRYLPVAAPLRVQAHPKNESHLGLIERLIAPLRPDAALQVLRSTELLEVRLSNGWFSEASGRWHVLGFGTNLLLPAVFLPPHHRGVGHFQPAEQGLWRVAALLRFVAQPP